MLGSICIAGGMHNALLEAEKLGLRRCRFSPSPQQWKAKPLSPETIATFRQHADRLGFTQIVAYDSYLINLAACDPELRHKSMAAFSHEIEHCNQLGIAYLVTHPGRMWARGTSEPWKM